MSFMTKQIKLSFIGLLLVVILPACLATAQGDNEATTPNVTDFQKKLNTVVSVDFKDAPIEDVIRSLADQADIDIIKSPKVTGNVTATLKNVPLSEALDNILVTNGYGRVTSASVVRIVPAAEVQTQVEIQTSKVYRIVYADIKEVEKALKGLLSSTGRIASNPGTNNIIVIDNPSQIRAIDDFITEIDRETSQVMVEARIYDISSSDSLDIGIQWSAGTNTTLTPPTSPTVGSPTGTGKLDPFIHSVLASTINQTSKSMGTFSFGILDDTLDIEATLTAIQEKLTAKLLANPRILVIDNGTADINIIKEIPYRELTQTSGGGNIGTTQFKDVGVMLKVTPHVTRDGMIRLHVHPTFSVQNGKVESDSGAGFGVPIVDTREATTIALIRDGQTVVIGGLRRKDVIQETSKIPLLGDIPLLGWAFTFHGENTTNSELVVFITPRIVKEAIMSHKESQFLDKTDKELCEPNLPIACMEKCPDKDKCPNKE
jgi:type IV pilus assembly protein PilQ